MIHRTIDFVREWMKVEDQEVGDWEREFANAIDARAPPEGWNLTKYGHPVPTVQVWMWHRLWTSGVLGGSWSSEAQEWYADGWAVGIPPSHWTVIVGPKPLAPQTERRTMDKPWYETDTHRDLTRIIPDMKRKIAEAKRLYAHCLPKGMFGPLEASITELCALRHEVAPRQRDQQA